VSKQNSKHDLKVLGSSCKHFFVRFENAAIRVGLTIIMIIVLKNL